MALGEWTLTRDRRPGDANRLATAGLGLVPGLAVIPHFETFGQGWVASARNALPDATLVGLDERTAAVWTPDGVWRAMGPGRVTVIGSDGTTRTGAGGAIDGLPQPRFAWSRSPRRRT